MTDVNDLISAIANGDMVRANDTFNGVMSSKLNDALDDTKIQIAQSMMGIQSEEDQEAEDIEDNDEL